MCKSVKGRLNAGAPLVGHKSCTNEGQSESVMVHLFTFLGPLLIVVGLVGSIRDLSGRSDRRF
jgi:hypothetical protein